MKFDWWKDTKPSKSNLQWLKIFLRTKAGLMELPHNWTILETAPKSRSYLITGYPYTTSDLELRNQVIKNQILSPSSVGDGRLGAICIGHYIPLPIYPYSVLVYVPLIN